MWSSVVELSDRQVVTWRCVRWGPFVFGIDTAWDEVGGVANYTKRRGDCFHRSGSESKSEYTSLPVCWNVTSES
jgi:hypothetical protein